MMKQFDPKKTIFLIDGSSFLYRAYYGLRALHTPAGEPVQAVYSFCRMIKLIIDKFSPDNIGLVWDSRGKTTRHEMYAEYKATRQAPPSDLSTQKDHILRFAEMIGIKNVAMQGIEADDLLYSIAQDLSKKGETVVIITSDKDMAQTLQEGIVIFDSFKDKIIDAQSFEESMGFPVSKLPFYFALLGDTSDNIPGVRGIGKKGAADLVKQFSSLQDLYENLDAVKTERLRRLLQEGRENAFLSEKLFLLQYIDLALSKEDFAFRSENWVQAQPLFEELGFKSMIKSGQKKAAASDIQAVGKRLDQYEFKCITSEKELSLLCENLAKSTAFAIDTETDGLDPLINKCVGISVCYQKGSAFYIPIAHATDEEQLPVDVVSRMLKPIFEDATRLKYMHNAKFDQKVLRGIGIDIRENVFDSFIGARLVLREWERAGLKALSELYLNEPMLSFKDLLALLKVKDFSEVPLELATKYSADDAHQTFQIAHIVHEKLMAEPILNALYKDVEGPLVNVLTAMEVEGIPFDASMMHDLGERVQKELSSAEQAIYDLSGIATINLNSPKQVEELLFVRLALPPQKKRAKGGFSTDYEVLSKLATMHPVPGLILKYRELSKLKNTYIDALPTYVNPNTHRIHTSFNQVRTATGRLSSSDPNLQNIPADSSDYGLEVRAAFKPKPGHVFISADYSQIELRVLAHLSQDANLVQAFAEGSDIHAETAARLFDVQTSQVTHQQRQIGKRINFSILYGLTPYGLSKDMNIPLKEAKQYIDAYFEQYSTVSYWMASVIQDVLQTGYVQTLMGRRRYIPTIFEKNRMLHEEAKRLAINTKVQGTAADIMKLGMVRIAELLKQKNLDAALVLQIHDEILVTCAKDQQKAVEELIRHELESIVAWDIPLSVTMRSGSSWKEVTK